MPISEQGTYISANTRSAAQRCLVQPANQRGSALKIAVQGSAALAQRYFSLAAAGDSVGQRYEGTV